MIETPRKFYPQADTIWIVRFERANGSYGTKAFLREYYAIEYANKLIRFGKNVRIFYTGTDWKDLAHFTEERGGV